MYEALPDMADLPPDVQACIAAQRAEFMDLKADFLGLNLTHAAVQKRFKSEMEAERATLAAERAIYAQAIQNRDTIIADLRM
ncbi:MAG: IS66 family transposase, partial [Alphaproteobacteria bacterium]|nr:IS66 family transposase [Alphaproteobacteria bacterium]